MKIILLLGFLFLNQINRPNSTTVYVCASKAKKYHYSPTCRGLSNCQYRIVKTTLAIAKSKGKTLCRWEDRNGMSENHKGIPVNQKATPADHKETGGKALINSKKAKNHK